jgi:ribosomal protein RSM22 (predicted rRNA methylase)
MCSFRQKLQRPEFLRKTKHSGKGEEDTGYTYLVMKRGDRPGVSVGLTEAQVDQSVGRVGAVGREEVERRQARLEGKSELREVEGGEFEMVSLGVAGSALGAESSVNSGLQEGDIARLLRDEAYSWPRLVAPPLKRSGHVVMDTCTASGELYLFELEVSLHLRHYPATHIPQVAFQAGLP